MRVVVVLKGYPRLSETFVAAELRALERRGFELVIVSLRHPTEATRHPVHAAMRAPVVYLPEYLHHEPARVARALAGAALRPGFAALMRLWWRDLRRDPTRNRARRLGQALVLAREVLGPHDRLYAHFIHTPGSVARYAARLTGNPLAFAAHAKDIWTIPEWEKREKLADVEFTVTCTAVGAAKAEDGARNRPSAENRTGCRSKPPGDWIRKGRTRRLPKSRSESRSVRARPSPCWPRTSGTV